MVKKLSLIAATLACGFGLLSAPHAQAAVVVSDADYQAALNSINQATCQVVLNTQRQYNAYSISLARNLAFAQAALYQGRNLDARETGMLNNLLNAAQARVTACGGSLTQ